MIYTPSQKLDTVLAKNFTHREIARSQLAARLGIDNTPPTHVLNRARTLAIAILQPLRDQFGTSFSPNSWYRCEELEKVLCAKGYAAWCRKRGKTESKNSWAEYFACKQHPIGQAADVEIPRLSNDKLFDWIRKNMTFDQLIREFPKPGDPMSGWVHVSYDTSGNRQQAFTIG